ncbi:MAG: hypothetical protein WCP86_05750 [bacterium]
MLKRQHRSANEYCDRLSSARNFGGAIIGDNWVATFLVHLDVLGPVFTMRWRPKMMNIPKGVAPSLSDVTETLSSCWRAMREDVKVEYSKFFLCVPAWNCRSVNGSCELPTSSRWPAKNNDRVRVDDRHVRALEKTIKKTKLPPGHALVDFIPRSFILDDGRRMMDPIGASTRTLGLDAHLVVVDGYWLNAVVASLNDIGVNVDAMTSTFAATADSLSEEEKLSDSIVIDVGARNTYLGFYNDGVLSTTRKVEGGSEDLIGRVAGDLRLPVAEVTASIAQFKLLLFSGDGDSSDDCPLFVWRTKQPVIRDMDNAAVPFADSLLNRIWHEVEEMQIERGAAVRNAVIMGDDPFVTRSLLSLMKEKTPLRCRLGAPENLHKSDESDSPGYAHMISMVRQHGSKASWDDGDGMALGSHGDSMANSILQDVHSIVKAQFAKLKGIDAGGSRRRLVLKPSFQTSGALLQTYGRSRYISGT